jgi:hypothetical protein
MHQPPFSTTCLGAKSGIKLLLKLRSLKRAMNLENSMNPGKDIA